MIGLGFVATLSIFGTGLAMMLQYRLMSVSNPLFASTVTLLMPIVAVAWGIIDGESFTFLQGMEYVEAPFNINDSVFGSCFYMATGFHGFHVFIGTCCLIVSLLRIVYNHFTSTHHFGFESAAWYWHFVDVVWLFLFITVYW